MIFTPRCETLLQESDALIEGLGREQTGESNVFSQGSSQDGCWCHLLTATPVKVVSWSWKQPKPCLLGMQEILSPAAPECHLLAIGGHHQSGRNLTCPGLSLWDFKRLLSNYTRGGNGTPLQYSCLENPMDKGAW